jgi:hypothetical protein
MLMGEFIFGAIEGFETLRGIFECDERIAGKIAFEILYCGLQ